MSPDARKTTGERLGGHIWQEDATLRGSLGARA